MYYPSTTALAVLGALIPAVFGREFSIFTGSRQFCPCTTGLSCPCTNTAIGGIAPVDDWHCDPLLSIYIQLGAGPDSCNNDPQHPVTPIESRFSMNVQGCRFGDSTGRLTFSNDADGETWNVHLPDEPNPELIRAWCFKPAGCEIGNEDSKTAWASTVCFAAAGEQSLVDAVYRCEDFTENTNDVLVCP